jgi:hypothetical protein
MFRHVRSRPTGVMLVVSCLCLACFGGKPVDLEITGSSVGPLDGQTPFDMERLQELLKGYSLSPGNNQLDGRSVSTYRVVRDGVQFIEIYPSADSTGISRIAVLSPDLEDPNGNHVGSVFSAVFGDQPPAVLTPGMSEFTGDVLCPAPGLSNVTYVFHGDWTGPAGVIPPQNVLDSWAVRCIIWKS